MNKIAAILIVLIFWNLISFALMGIDKHKARKNKRRISERTLFLSAFLFGGVGILSGMHIFHHKTKHWSFKILIPIATIINIVIFYFIFKL